MEDIKHFTGDDNFVSFEFAVARKAINQPIELTRGLV